MKFSAVGICCAVLITVLFGTGCQKTTVTIVGPSDPTPQTSPTPHPQPTPTPPPSNPGGGNPAPTPTPQPTPTPPPSNPGGGNGGNTCSGQPRVTFPANGAIVSGTVTIQCTQPPGGCAAGVAYHVCSSGQSCPPWTFNLGGSGSWNTTSAATGGHQLYCSWTPNGGQIVVSDPVRVTK